MKLDERIKDGKRPLTCFDIEEAKEFIGKQCYFTDDIEEFANIDDFFRESDGHFNYFYNGIGDLIFFKHPENERQPFHCLQRQLEEFSFCLPCEWVDLDEWD